MATTATIPDINLDYGERISKKLAEIIDTYGVTSPEFNNYKKKHANNKFGLLYMYRMFGVKSNLFFEFIKPFLVKQMNHFSYNEVTEDDLHNCYVRMVLAHCGGYVIDKTGQKVWKDPWVDNMDTITPTRWINFLITLCRSVVTNRDYRLKKYHLEIEHNDRLDDTLSHSKIDNLNYSSYSMKNFIFEQSMQDHLNELISNKPANNVIYSMIQWSLLSETENSQDSTSYNLGE